MDDFLKYLECRYNEKRDEVVNWTIDALGNEYLNLADQLYNLEEAPEPKWYARIALLQTELQAVMLVMNERS
ncbi:MAG: hypothetical protein OXL40_05355 [Bacteroidota bacterium]|nr:hypothetical protein [Bacteroidota bacterium]